MGIACGTFRIPLPQGFLYDTEIFCRGIKIRAAAVAEYMTGNSFLLITVTLSVPFRIPFRESYWPKLRFEFETKAGVRLYSLTAFRRDER